MLYVELHATGPNHDVHSGAGGVVPNPAWRLVRPCHAARRQGQLHHGRPGRAGRPAHRAGYAAAEAMPFDEKPLCAVYGLDHWQRGLTGRDVLYAEMFDPTANIAGFHSGYGGAGSKTIVPSTAMVKMDFRLVPHQTPEKMMELLRAHFDKRGYE